MALICVASPVGGAGRTTLAANLAGMLSQRGRRVIALDLDPQNSLGLHFGLDPKDGFGFLSTLRYAADSRAAWRAALRTTKDNVSFLPHGHVGLDGANALTQALATAPDSLASAVRDMLSTPHATVIADLPSGPSAALSALIPQANMILVPLRPDAVSMTQVAVVESGRFAGQGSANVGADERIAFVFNQVEMRTRLGRAITDAAVLLLRQRLIGRVRHDEFVPEAMAAQRLLADAAPQAEVTRDVAALADAISTRLYGSVATPG